MRAREILTADNCPLNRDNDRDFNSRLSNRYLDRIHHNQQIIGLELMGCFLVDKCVASNSRRRQRRAHRTDTKINQWSARHTSRDTLPETALQGMR